MTTAPGFDVSHYQDDKRLAYAVTHGNFVFVKATESTNYVDPEHDHDVAIIRAAKRTVGHYHFGSSVHSAIAEAQYFLANAHLVVGDLVALDLEKMDGNWEQRAAFAVAWLAYVHAHTGAIPLWYTNGSWHSALLGSGGPNAIALAAYPNWIATAGRAAGDPGTTGWLIHQFSTGGGIDHDLSNHWPLTPYAVPAPKPTTPPPTPIPPHGPPPVTIGPRVALHRVSFAALNDSAKGAPPVGHYPSDVRPVCAALVAHGLLAVKYVANGSFGPPVRVAYAAWEKQCGVVKPTGVPGPGTLTKLGQTPGHQFTVTP